MLFIFLLAINLKQFGYEILFGVYVCVRKILCEWYHKKTKKKNNKITQIG